MIIMIENLIFIKVMMILRKEVKLQPNLKKTTNRSYVLFLNSNSDLLFLCFILNALVQIQ